jgi:long-chain acyl-CoA synthetase
METANSIPALLLRRVKARGDEVAHYTKQGGKWTPSTWREVGASVTEIGLGLRTLGIAPGDRVAIAAETRPEWAGTDLGILGVGGVTVGLYPTMAAEQMKYVLDHSESKAVVVDRTEMAKKILAAQGGAQRPVFVMEPSAAEAASRVESLDALRARGREQLQRDAQAFEKSVAERRRDEMCTIIYTSGTTGPPKGAMLSHGSWLWVADTMLKVVTPHPDDALLLFLPLAHSLQRAAAYTALYSDVYGAGYYAESLEKVPENLMEVRPTVLATVPRMLEKIYGRVMSMAAANPMRKRLFDAALRTGKAFARARRLGEKIPLGLRARHGGAERLVFRKIRARLGGRVRLMVSGGAPLSVEVAEFFEAIGIPVLEGYGLTETCAPATVNREGRYRFGTVGHPLPGVEVKIADDGEILIKSPGNFLGYYKDEAATQAAMPDGWLRTGDIGTLDPDGYLVITDRKKDLIITAAGKNIAPQNIEAMLRQHRGISNVCVVGDQRPYCVALVTVDLSDLRAMNPGLPAGAEDAARHPFVESLVAQAIEATNAHLAKYETIKKWRVLAGDFTQDGGEITPTLKLKRRVVAEKYAKEIASLYGDA